MSLAEYGFKVRGVERVLGVESVVVSDVPCGYGIWARVTFVVEAESDGVPFWAESAVSWGIPVSGDRSVRVIDGQAEICWCADSLRNRRCGRSRSRSRRCDNCCCRCGPSGEFVVLDDQLVVVATRIGSQCSITTAVSGPNRVRIRLKRLDDFGRNTLPSTVVPVIILSDERPRRVVQPQIRVCARLIALTVGVAVDVNGFRGTHGELPLGLC